MTFAHIIAEIGFFVALAGSVALLVKMLREDHDAILDAIFYRPEGDQ